ncbi:hypothetical protein G5714_018295 [Onychostoma macrolepis]|uniref:Uncharacterized protein n=1 Tax=Onychostoma macrolepis TaxID=369639 RepID=A0A7J6BYN3_9TELE|nr:hypothetical protein G5714_018295 [Onychostoma macrolepis]
MLLILAPLCPTRRISRVSRTSRLHLPHTRSLFRNAHLYSRPALHERIWQYGRGLTHVRNLCQLAPVSAFETNTGPVCFREVNFRGFWDLWRRHYQLQPGFCTCSPYNCGQKLEFRGEQWTTACMHIVVTYSCISALRPWRNPEMFSRGIQLGLGTACTVVMMDALTSGCGTRRLFGKAEVDLFMTSENTHWPLSNEE